MVGWHHCLDVREFEQVPGVGDEQRPWRAGDSWGLTESYTTEGLN